MSKINKDNLEIKEFRNLFVLMRVNAGSKFDTSNDKSGSVLGLASGYFAGEAWAKNDGSFDSVSGSSFGIVTGDDNSRYCENKRTMSRPTTDEIIEHSDNCCDDFINRCASIHENYVEADV